MSYTSPKTWIVGDVLTASDLNTYVRDNTTALVADIAAAQADANASLRQIAYDDAEHSATALADGASFTGLSIPISSTIIIRGNARKTAGAAASFDVGMSLNGGSTLIYLSPISDAANSAGSGYFEFIIGAYVASNTYGSKGHGSFLNAASTFTYADAKMNSQRPNATVTSAKIYMLPSSGSITCYTSGVKLWVMDN